MGKKLGLKEVPLIKIRGQTKRIEPIFAGAKDRKIPNEIVFHAGISGRVVDLFTKKVIQDAKVTVTARNQVYERMTSTLGTFVIEDLELRGLKREMLGQHRKYIDGYGTIQKIVVDQIAPQDDILLDPKRVNVTGKISETFRPKNGSGLKGIKVGFDGYPQFQTATDENGFYSIKNVPASLTDFSVDDLTEGHQPAKQKLDLNPETVNEHVDFTLVPNLTEVQGQVTSRGQPVSGLQVILPGFPEYVVVTDQNGNYKFSDIPQGVTNVEVLSDPEVVYIGKQEAIPGFKAYKKHSQNVIVKYNRSDITGRVYDVVSKRPVSGVKVYVEGAEQKYNGVTDQYGAYKIVKVPSTATTLLLKNIDQKFVWRPRLIDPSLVPGDDVSGQDFRVVPRDYIKNNIVFILTWNERQPDLDSQIFLPDGRHLYFKTLGDNSFSTKGGATLDKDDTGVAGRETTVIFMKDSKTVQAGKYRFLVFQYVNQNITFQQGGALVEVYKDGEFLKEIKPSAGRGRVWYVGLVDNGSLSVIDQFPAGELYEQLDTLEKELKDNSEKPQRETEIYNQLVNQENTIVSDYNTNVATLKQLNLDLESVKDGKEPVLPIVVPEPPVVIVPVKPEHKVPAITPAATTPITPQMPGTSSTGVPVQQVATVATPPPPPPPHVATQAEKIIQVQKEIHDLEIEIKATNDRLVLIRDQMVKKKAVIDQLPTWIANRKNEIDNEKASIDQRIEQILENYR